MLLSECFNCDEYDFPIDYELSDEVKQIVDQFDASRWETTSLEEKKELVSSLVNAVAESLDIRDIPEVVYYKGGIDDFGNYNPDRNTISINELWIYDGEETLNTSMHELRHAYQHDRASRGETMEDAIYKFNFDNYISPYPLPDGNYLFFSDYFDQYVEVDARVFANIFSEAIEQ